MDSVDLEVLKRCAEWLSAVGACCSSPSSRRGAARRVRQGPCSPCATTAFVEGSVSGGCVEDDLVGRVRADGMTARDCTVVTYGVSADEARSLRIALRGHDQLVLEPLGSASGIRDLLAATEGGRLVARKLELPPVQRRSRRPRAATASPSTAAC
jgi:xanthine dehydrogenase accessory factor